MTLAIDKNLLFKMVLVGFGYYVGAWLGVHQTITPEGIAILWLLPVKH